MSLKMAAAPANGPQRIAEAERAPAHPWVIAVAAGGRGGSISLSAN